MKANNIISVRSASGKVLSDLLIAFDKFNINTCKRVCGEWVLTYE